MAEVVSLATRALALYSREDKVSIRDIALRLYGQDTVYTRRKVNSLIDEALAKAAKAH